MFLGESTKQTEKLKTLPRIEQLEGTGKLAQGSVQGTLKGKVFGAGEQLVVGKGLPTADARVHCFKREVLLGVEGERVG